MGAAVKRAKQKIAPSVFLLCERQNVVRVVLAFLRDVSKRWFEENLRELENSSSKNPTSNSTSDGKSGSTLGWFFSAAKRRDFMSASSER